MNVQEKFVARCKAIGLPVPSVQSNEIIYFKSLTGAQARELLNSGAANPHDRQNSAPSFEEITKFLEEHPKFTGHGYIVMPARSDERITLEGVMSRQVLSRADKADFSKMFGEADEFSLKAKNARAWYD